jgi:hypothetical protein
LAKIVWTKCIRRHFFLDNVIGVWEGMEWAQYLGHDAFFIVIELEKAYDRVLLKLIKKYLGKCFSSPRRLRGEKVPNVDPSHLICEMQIKR